MIGEIGGAGEELAAFYIREQAYPKKVIAFIAGSTAPPEKKMGHPGAIHSQGFGTAASKIRQLETAGVNPGAVTILFLCQLLGVIYHPLKINHNHRFISDNPGIMSRSQHGYISCFAISYCAVIRLNS